MRHRSRGIVLILALITSILVAMVISAAVILLQGRMGSATNLQDRQDALAAAESGYQYAQARLQKDPGWKGSDNPSVSGGPAAQIVGSENIVVHEQRGNVLGILTGPDGRKSMFRIRFNYQNGSGSPHEGFNGNVDPDANYMFSSPYISYNNINTPTSAAMPHGTGGSFVAASSQSCPKFSAIIVVEGLAGNGLRDVTVTNPNPPSASSGVTRVTIANNLCRKDLAMADSSVYAAAGINLGNADVDVDSEASDTAPRVRSLLDASTGDTFNTAGMDGGTADAVQVVVDTAKHFFRGATTDPTTITQKKSAAEQLRHWTTSKWSEITKANPANTLPSGTYVWRAEAGVNKLFYFNQQYTVGTIPATGGTEFTGAAGVTVKPSDCQLEITTDIAITGDLGFAMVANTDTATSTAVPLTLHCRPQLKFTGTTPPILSNESATNGNIRVDGSIQGKGSVTTTGDLTFQGNSIFEADPADGVALYALKNINIEKIPFDVTTPVANTPGHHGKNGKTTAVPAPTPKWFTPTNPNPFGSQTDADVAFGGLVWAGGNVTAEIGDIVGKGNFYVRGMLVANGGADAEGGLPDGTPNQGTVNIDASKAHFNYDPNYLAGLKKLNAPGKLARAMCGQVP